ncbi:MAG TPA: diacylglycerol kinase family protein [Thermoanaerobaculia bacterium]|nr:diacylglycerol kinase family protein [Thermoanaerobaculia bacterium]
MRHVFLFNPAAGKGRTMRDRERIRSSLAAAGLEGDFLETERPGHAADLAEEAGNPGVDVVVAIGGDGTVNETVNGLMRLPAAKRPALGLLPDGTGNDYGFALGLRPGDLADASRVLARGKMHVFDVGEVNGRFFANSVGLGFDGAVAEAASKVRYLKGFPAYLWSVFKVLKGWTNFELTLTADGRVLEGLAFLAAVANGPRSGGGFLLAPAARPDDGLFDVCRLGNLGRLEALRHLPKALDGSHVGLPWVTIVRAREVVLASDRPLTAHVDGNLVLSAGHPDPLVFRMHPGALRVIGKWKEDGAQGRN